MYIHIPPTHYIVPTKGERKCISINLYRKADWQQQPPTSFYIYSVYVRDM